MSVELVPLADAVAPVRERFAELIAAAQRWSAARGEEPDPDLLALVCAGAQRWDEADLDAPLVWTRVGVRILVRCGVPNWCSSRGTRWPLEVVPATWRWLDFLHGTGRLDPRSDPLWELRKPLICYGGLDFEGRWRPEGDPSPIPCECYLPYRASAGLLNNEILAGRLVEDALVWHPADDAEDGIDTATLGRSWTSDRPSPGRARRSGRRVGVRRRAGVRRTGRAGGAGPPGSSPG